jgi:hypothetical protein
MPMPNPNEPVSPQVAPKSPPTDESTAYLAGLFTDFQQQVHKYAGLTRELMSLKARIVLAERMLCLVRDHFAIAVRNSDSAMPHDWKRILGTVRFVGWRLADSCVELLKEQKRLTPEELRDALNLAMFRFRTNAPLREIHAALLRQPSVKRVDDAWVWVGEQTTMPLHVVKRSSDDKENAPDNPAERETADEQKGDEDVSVW